MIYLAKKAKLFLKLARKEEYSMTQVNMLEAKSDLSKLVKMLESHQEEVIYLARNGTPVAQMTLIPKKSAEKRIGVAEGKFKIPEDFNAWDKDVEDMFGDAL